MALPIRQAANVVSIWLQELAEPLEIYTDSSYDTQLFAELLAEAAVRPRNLGSSTVFVLSDAGAIAQENAFAAGLRRHHALDDAKALLAGWKVCGQS